MAINDAPSASEPTARSNRCDLIKRPFISIPPFELLDNREHLLAGFAGKVVRDGEHVRNTLGHNVGHILVPFVGHNVFQRYVTIFYDDVNGGTAPSA